MDNPRSRAWCMVLYPEDDSHVQCIELLQTKGVSFACILHDKDVWEKDESPNHVAGEPKKPHWHVVLYVKNPRYRNSLAEEFGIKPNYLEVCRSRDSALLYLVHDGYPDKYQYDIDDVFGSLVSNLEKLLLCEDEESRVMAIVDMIDKSPTRLTYRDILKKVCENKLYGDFRRMGSGVRYLLDEHNMQFEPQYKLVQSRLDNERFCDTQVKNWEKRIWG